MLEQWKNTSNYRLLLHLVVFQCWTLCERFNLVKPNQLLFNLNLMPGKCLKSESICIQNTPSYRFCLREQEYALKLKLNLKIALLALEMFF